MLPKLLLFLSLGTFSQAVPSAQIGDIIGEAIGAVAKKVAASSCTADGVPGICASVSKGQCSDGSFIPGHCPKSADNQCCIKSKCKNSSGACLSVKHSGCSGGTFKSGECPGDNDFKCCIKSVGAAVGEAAAAVAKQVAASSCTADGVPGICASVSKGQCSDGSFIPGHCPKSADNQCCIKSKCKNSAGTCLSVKYSGCSGGTFISGKCPGDSDFKCCVKSAGTSAPPSSPPASSSWPNCQENLSCTFEVIAGTSMPERLAYVRYMQSNFFGKLNAQNQYRAIEGVITFFQKKSLGQPRSWISYVDAGIVEGIQRGGAMALRMSDDNGGNKGSGRWKTFLEDRRDGKLNDRDVRTI